MGGVLAVSVAPGQPEALDEADGIYCTPVVYIRSWRPTYSSKAVGQPSIMHGDEAGSSSLLPPS